MIKISSKKTTSYGLSKEDKKIKKQQEELLGSVKSGKSGTNANSSVTPKQSIGTPPIKSGATNPKPSIGTPPVKSGATNPKPSIGTPPLKSGTTTQKPSTSTPPVQENKSENYNSLPKPTYQKSKELLASEENLENWENQKPEEYKSRYSDEIDSVLNEILNRGEFNYSMSSDPLYEQYKEMYTLNGKKAMMDTIGEAAALTGGYGNSYAVAAGNQAYQQSLEQLNDIAMDLRDRAFEEYKYNGEKLLDDAQLLRSLDGDDYDKYLDLVQQYYKDGDYLLNKIASMSDREFELFSRELQSWENDRDFAFKEYQDMLDRDEFNRQLDFSKQKEANAQDQFNRQLDFNKQKDALDRDEFNRQLDFNKQKDALDRDEFNRQLNFNKQKEENDQDEFNRQLDFNKEKEENDQDEFNRQLDFNKQKEENDQDEFNRQFNFNKQKEENDQDEFNRQFEFKKQEAIRDQANEDRKYELSVRKANSSGSKSSSSSSSGSSKSSSKDKTTVSPPVTYKEFYTRTGVSTIMTEDEFAASSVYKNMYKGDYRLYLEAMYKKYG